VADDNVIELDAEKRKRQTTQKLLGLIHQGNLIDARAAIDQAITENGGHAKPPPVPLKSLVSGAMTMVRQRASGEAQPVETPWRQLNATMGGGLWPGAHFLVAGTGVGKSQLSFQLALHAAKRGVPVGLIALELDQNQMVVRLAAEHAGVSQWSTVYTGKANEADIRKIEDAAEAVGELPIVTDFGSAMGWPASRLSDMANAIRSTNESGPALIVLDFVQLISSEPKDDGKRVDLRERIGRAAYLAREIAREQGITVVIISSTSRENYKGLSGTLGELGLGKAISSHGETYRQVWKPDKLIGMGKESGELEYAADSVHVLLHPTTQADVHRDIETARQVGKVVVCATVKVRAGIPSWFALGFANGRFSELSDEAINSLAPTKDEWKESETKKKAGRPNKEPNDYVLAVVNAIHDSVSAGKKLSSPTSVQKAAGGNSANVKVALEEALTKGYVRRDDPIDDKSHLVFVRWPPKGMPITVDPDAAEEPM
jgi:replicative DNA helicase